jgi:dolichol-phosphate mannosyltransferase
MDRAASGSRNFGDLASGGDLTISVVAPCFNEEAVLPEFLRRCVAACAKTGRPYEIVLVDDGSRDSTWSIIRAAAAESPQIRGIQLARNFGHQIALSAGLQAAQGACVMAIDADLQDPPEMLSDMLQLMEAEDADVVYGQRYQRIGETAFKRWSAHIFYRLIRNLSDVDIPVDTGDFRLMRRHVVAILNQMPERQRFIRGMVAWTGGKQIPIRYARDPRYAGETKYSVSRMALFALDAVLGFSRRPLAIATYVGILVGVFSFGLGVWSIIGWLLDLNVPGWTSLLSAIGLLFAFQMLFMGLLGEYVGRLSETSKGRPLFIVSRHVGDGLAGQAAPPARHTDEVARP